MGGEIDPTAKGRKRARRMAGQGGEGAKAALVARLRRRAHTYLDRYGGTTQDLRRVLARKLERHWRRQESEAEPGEPVERDRAAETAALDQIVDELTRLGLLDDRRVAEVLARRLRRRGASARLVAARLSGRGIDSELAGQALASADTEAGNAELAAAMRFARGRRLGPYRPVQTREEERQRDLARLGRRGFSGSVARTVIDAEDADALERAVSEELD